MTTIRTIPASVLAVDLAQAKRALGIEADMTALDDQVEAWTRGVIATAERLTGQRLMEQTWEVRLDAFPCGAVRLPHPVLEVESIKYLDTAGTERTMAPTATRVKREAYTTSVKPVAGTSWPATMAEEHAVIITVKCGFGSDPSATPDEFRAYILAKLVEQFDPLTRPDRDTVQTSYIDGLLDCMKTYA